MSGRCRAMPAVLAAIAIVALLVVATPIAGTRRTLTVARCVMLVDDLDGDAIIFSVRDPNDRTSVIRYDLNGTTSEVLFGPEISDRAYLVDVGAEGVIWAMEENGGSVLMYRDADSGDERRIAADPDGHLFAVLTGGRIFLTTTEDDGRYDLAVYDLWLDSTTPIAADLSDRRITARGDLVAYLRGGESGDRAYVYNCTADEEIRMSEDDVRIGGPMRPPLAIGDGLVAWSQRPVGSDPEDLDIHAYDLDDGTTVPLLEGENVSYDLCGLGDGLLVYVEGTPGSGPAGALMVAPLEGGPAIMLGDAGSVKGTVQVGGDTVAWVDGGLLNGTLYVSTERPYPEPVVIDYCPNGDDTDDGSDGGGAVDGFQASLAIGSIALVALVRSSRRGRG